MYARESEVKSEMWESDVCDKYSAPLSAAGLCLLRFGCRVCSLMVGLSFVGSACELLSFAKRISVQCDICSCSICRILGGAWN